LKNIKNFLFLFTPSELFKSKTIIALLFFGSCLEVAGLTLIIPIITLVASNEGYNTISSFLSTIGFKIFTKNELIYYFIVLIFFFYLFKTTYLHLVNAYRNKFIYDFQENISQRLFISYLYKSYDFFLKHNSSQLISNCTEGVNRAVYSLECFFVLFTEIFILLFFSIILISYKPAITISAIIILFILIFGFYFYYSKKLKVWGKERTTVYEHLVKNLQEGFSGIRDIIINNKFLFFLDSFSNLNKKNSYFLYKNSVGVQNPKYFLEFMGVCFILGIIYYLVFNNSNNVNLITILSMFALSFFRLMPSFYRILSSYQIIKFNYLSIINLKDSLSEENINKSKNAFTINTNYTFNKCIEFNDVSFDYNNEKIILRDINLRINKNEIVGIVGETGSGKSTFLDLLLGLLNPNSGKILIDDRLLVDIKEDWQANIAYVSQNFYFIDDSLLSNISFGSHNNINKNKIIELLKRFNLGYLATRIENGSDVNIGERGSTLSMGEKQRISIIKALYKDSPILIFDEITSSLDSVNEKMVIDEIKKIKENKTIIFVSHKTSSLAFCDSIYELKNQVLKKVIIN
jgi:ABC-type multidrug transport system fused ATPase/permease subunit